MPFEACAVQKGPQSSRKFDTPSRPFAPMSLAVCSIVPLQADGGPDIDGSPITWIGIEDACSPPSFTSASLTEPQKTVPSANKVHCASGLLLASRCRGSALATVALSAPAVRRNPVEPVSTAM